MPTLDPDATKSANGLSLERLLRTAFVLFVAAWIVGLFDALNVLRRGGSAAMIPLTFVLLGAAALALGVALWIGAELSTRLGTRAYVALRARGLPAPHPLEWPTALLSVGLAAAVFPMHLVVERALGRMLGRAVGIGYVFFPALVTLATFLVARLVRRVLEKNTSRAVVVGVAGGALVLAFAIHYANAQLYAGLYGEIHRPMSLAVLVVVVLGLAGLGASLPFRFAVRALGGLLAVTLLLLPFVGNPVRAHVPIAFFGTELLYFYEGVGAVLDHDGDGYASRLGGGDCDDHNAAVSPAAIEVADNGIDDNCILGDMKRVPRLAAPRPTVDEGVAAWRVAHPHPNLLLLFIDTLRADRLGVLGLHPGLTPNLDALAAGATVFEQARTTAPRTPHALMALLRGRFNGRILEQRADIADPGRDTIVFHMQELGYTTFARLVGSEWPDFHLSGGWDHLTMGQDVYRMTGPSVTYAATEWLAALPPSPFFMMLHYADPHAPYFEHEETPKGSSMVGRYDSEVAFTDAQIGIILDDITARGLLANTIVLAFGDHGENLGDHGDAGGNHGVSLFEEVVRIPIVLYVPDAAPTRVSAPVSIADIGPTLLDLTGGRPLVDPDGCSLAGYAFGHTPAPKYTISEFYDFGHLLRAIVKGRYKLVVDVRHNAWMLFDILEDPGEQHDLTDARPDLVHDLRETLDRWIEERADTNAVSNDRCARTPR
jgi:hypothetical protein